MNNAGFEPTTSANFLQHCSAYLLSNSDKADIIILISQFFKTIFLKTYSHFI